MALLRQTEERLTRTASHRGPIVRCRRLKIWPAVAAPRPTAKEPTDRRPNKSSHTLCPCLLSLIPFVDWTDLQTRGPPEYPNATCAPGVVAGLRPFDYLCYRTIARTLGKRPSQLASSPLFGHSPMELALVGGLIVTAVHLFVWLSIVFAFARGMRASEMTSSDSKDSVIFPRQ